MRATPRTNRGLRYIMSAFSLTFILTLGCYGDDDETDTDTDTETDTDTDTAVMSCATLDEAACIASSECAPIYGALASEVCAGDYSNWMSLYGGCMSAHFGCGDALTCGVNPTTGEEWIFADTCLPDGWAGCSFCP